jgi:hypothetical protein
MTQFQNQHHEKFHLTEMLYIRQVCTYQDKHLHKIDSVTDKCLHLEWVGGFPPDTLVYSTNKTDRHNIAEILLKVALSTINQRNN